MTMPYFSLELSKALSILCPEFSGHWWYFQAVCSVEVQCLPEAEAEKFEMFGHTKICPAWQVEDVLRNLKTLAPYIKHQDPVPVEIFFKPKVVSQEYTICCNHSVKEYVLPWEIMVSELTSLLVMYPDTAYQKIEEYLWSILK